VYFPKLKAQLTSLILNTKIKAEINNLRKIENFCSIQHCANIQLFLLLFLLLLLMLLRILTQFRTTVLIPVRIHLLR